VAQARHRSRLVAVVAIGLGLAGCGGGGVPTLVERHPNLASIPGQRLADAHPYVLLHDGGARFFHCRWPDGATIPVSLPPEAGGAERRLLETALRAWENAGLGIHFERVPDATTHGIAINFVGGSVDTAAGQDTANTVVDCRIAPLSQQTGGTIAGAELVSARIRIARLTNADMLGGHQRPLSDSELVGAALHELGHALGFQGHARQGDTVMVREVERMPRAGKRLLQGEPFGDSSLRALYRLPSGALVGGGPVDRCRSDAVDRLAALAEANALDGPFVRVGESAARIFWRSSDGVEYGIVIARLREGLRDPNRFFVLPESRVRGSLAPGKDVACGTQ
jgi:hypothetical protein